MRYQHAAHSRNSLLEANGRVCRLCTLCSCYLRRRTRQRPRQRLDNAGDQEARAQSGICVLFATVGLVHAYTIAFTILMC